MSLPICNKCIDSFLPDLKEHIEEDEVFYFGTDCSVCKESGIFHYAIPEQQKEGMSCLETIKDFLLKVKHKKDKSGDKDMKKEPTSETHANVKGYRPEYLDDRGKWHAIRMKTTACGIERSRFNKEIMSLTNLMGYEAAQALAWAFLANFKDKCKTTRIVPYTIDFSYSTYKEEYEAEEITVHKEK